VHTASIKFTAFITLMLEAVCTYEMSAYSETAWHYTLEQWFSSAATEMLCLYFKMLKCLDKKSTDTA
jgi:hypothetical protein